MNKENKTWTFPAGEVGVTYFVDTRKKSFDLKLLGGRQNQIMEVLLQANAIRAQVPDAQIHLICPYVPYGRQDRVSAPGTSFSLEVFAQVIGTGKFESITIVDPHSPVTIQELQWAVHNVYVYEACDFVDQRIIQSIPYDVRNNVVVLAPDKGAKRRADECANVLHIDKVHYASKVRDPATGEIIGIEAPTIKPHHHVLVIDDICDGGRTFIELAKVLNCASKTLFVTHGIFSNGFRAVAEHYNTVWTTDSFDPFLRPNVIPLNKRINW